MIVPALALSLLIAAAGGAAPSGSIAGRAPAETVVFLSVPVAEMPSRGSEPVLRLEIQNGRVQPRVSATPVGAALRIKSLDAVFSDFSVYFGLSELAFRRKFVLPGDVSKTKLSRPGLMTLENENSPADRAYIYVAPTPVFAISDSAGRYRLENVPAGKRRITAWDEKKGTRDRDVVVRPGATTVLDFEK